MRIPDDVYERVADLCSELVEASAGDDRRAHWRAYDELREYCRAQAAAGRDDPFLWETLADFTVDASVAIDLYQRGLKQAQQLRAAEYEASLRLALARRYRETGATAVAYEHALAVNECARGFDDLALRREISQLLLDLSS